VQFFGAVYWKQGASCALCNDFGRCIEDRGQAEFRALRSEGSCAPCNALGRCIEVRGQAAFRTKVLGGAFSSDCTLRPVQRFGTVHSGRTRTRTNLNPYGTKANAAGGKAR
jgi:hypothetical protein